MNDIDIVVIGSSSGGISALEKLLKAFDNKLDVTIVIAQHMSPDSGDSIKKLLKKYSTIELKEPIDKEELQSGCIYIAPADYHLLIERAGYFAVNLGPKVNFCRPSVDLLFETAAEAFPERVLGVVLTGANGDGTEGCRHIKKFNGLVVAQNPDEAQINVMPLSVINAGLADYVLSLKEISDMINRLCKKKVD